jgi:hypothetical protein
MINDNNFSPDLLAPCGINCGVCIAYLRAKNKCPGCRNIRVDTSKYRLNCRIRNCEQIAGSSPGFCYNCTKPYCKRMKQLDKRYHTRYKTSLIANLESLRTKGLEAFLTAEAERWQCKSCGSTLSIHRETCMNCGIPC